MQRFIAVLQYLFLPFELLGAFLLAVPLFLWKGLLFLCGKFLLSPWGLLVPATFLVLLFFVTEVSKTPFRIAEQYANELKTCKEEDIAAYTNLLIQLDEAGLSGLVSGINSEREAVFNICFEGLQNEIKKHQQFRNPKNPFRWELKLSKTLLEQTPLFRSSAQIASAALTRSLIRSLTDGIELSYKREQNGDMQKANRNCIQILDLLEAANNQLEITGKSDNAQKRETAALFHPRYAHPVLMAANGKPLFNSADGTENNMYEELMADTMSVPNAERLLAYHQSPQFAASQNYLSGSMQGNIQGDIQGDVLESNNSDGNKGTRTLLAQMRPAAPILAQPILADIAGKTASGYEGTQGIDNIDDVDIISDYIVSKKSVPNKLKSSAYPNSPEITDVKIPKRTTDNGITDALRSVPLNKVSSLSTVNLMRILHHSDSAVVAEAENTLTIRDGFRGIHLQLAHSLFHPDSAVRKELVKKLPQTAGIPQHIWLLELMNDPDADVRYQAAVYLMTASDPALRRMLAEKGKQDTDERIVNLAEKISGNPPEPPRR
ncbi:hypothetical protein FACS189427_02710 [Planctomycetales bacterium]|nr:hypothetical protein FACS189427_02710 [Planctomycetales bacterium]